MTERFIVDASDHDPRDWEPAERPSPAEYDDRPDPEPDPDPTVFVEVTFSDGTRARWAFTMREADEAQLDLTLKDLFGDPDTILT